MTFMRILCLLLAIHRPALTGPEMVAEEYQVKGAFLLNFAKFVAWPANAFKTPDDPIVICILGQNPFGPALERAAQSAIAGKRSIQIHTIQTFQQAGSCQIVFASSAERKRVRGLFDALHGEAVLSVGESEGFLAAGGMIAFKLEGEKVRIEINQQAAERAGLRISAKLLSLAQAGRR
ncbi:hypothetical protein F183_A28480 [Bryobacterales bacterium F-183]|nr:hypothetical protein F183_A28480 [Bryobacterales bacterium F-183]